MMKYYRVHCYEDHGVSTGYAFFCNKKEAQKYSRENDGTIEVIEVKPTKPGIMWALRKFASHPDNG